MNTDQKNNQIQMCELQNEPFVIRRLDGAQFLSPAIETNAIKLLAHKMTTHFLGANIDSDDKPTCVTCFDVSGSGKTTTIKEAAKISNSTRAPISLINNQIFTELFLSCRNFGELQNPPLKLDDLVSYDIAEKYMSARFDTVLMQLFQSIIVTIKYYLLKSF